VLVRYSYLNHTSTSPQPSPRSTDDSRSAVIGGNPTRGEWLSSGRKKATAGLLRTTLGCLALACLFAATPACVDAAPSGPDLVDGSFQTNLADYPDARVPLYSKFELAFDISQTTATNPYLPFDPTTPTGVAPGTGITVDALLLPPGEADWENARLLPCFYYQPVEEVGTGSVAALLPIGPADWRCRFAPDVTGTWRYKVRATDAGGTSESTVRQFVAVASANKGFVKVSETDSRFFEYSDGTPFVTPLINLEQSSPLNTLARIRETVPRLGENGMRFVRWFPNGEGANYFVAPFGDTIRINWGFGDTWATADGADTESGKRFSLAPYYYSAQTIPVVPGARYRLSFRANVTGDRVLRAQLGNLSGGTIDICSASSSYHEGVGQSCEHAADGWHDYEVEVKIPSGVSVLSVGMRGLYVSADAPSPFNAVQDGALRVHSIRLQRDESGSGVWGGNLLTRSDPDTFTYVDQRSAAQMDEIFRLSEQHGVTHKLPLFHKNDALLGRIQPDGSDGEWDVDNFYSDDGQAARWYEGAYARYFVARWSHSTSLHSVELANENYFDADAQSAAFAIAGAIRDASPRHILQSNSFWGWWVADFWTHPEYGDLMDYSDKHWYANEAGAYCDDQGENCELISNVWDDSAAYVRECWARFREYEATFGYDKPIVRGEGGVAEQGTGPQHVELATEPTGVYYHKKLWAHLGVLGSTCDGEWYPNLGSAYAMAATSGASYDLDDMFAAYEDFIGDEPLSNGSYVEIGTDLTGSQGIAVTHVDGNVRAWGVQDASADRTLLWVDNADHTWQAVAQGVQVAPASATLTLSGFDPGKSYVASALDAYPDDGGDPSVGHVFAGLVRDDGSLSIVIEDLARDVAVRVVEAAEPVEVLRYYLPLMWWTTD